MNTKQSAFCIEKTSEYVNRPKGGEVFKVFINHLCPYACRQTSARVGKGGTKMYKKALILMVILILGGKLGHGGSTNISGLEMPGLRRDGVE